MNTPNAADVVPDIVDAVLLGSHEEIARLRGTMDREGFYDQLRARHADPRNGPNEYFNDMLFAPNPASDASAKSEVSERRYFSFFPALPLRDNLELGEWIVGTPPDGIPWASERFRELSATLVRSYEKLGFKGAAMLWHRARGFDGSRPSDNHIRAIVAAVAFALLDANDRLRLIKGDDGNKFWDMATTENADLFIQPIIEADGGITHQRGGFLRKEIVGGLKIGGDPPPLADAVRPIRAPVPVSTRVARQLFAAVLTREYDPAPSIAVAAEWHRSALANPSAVSMQQRLVALKTGFEALFSTSSSATCAKKLRGLFNSTMILPRFGGHPLNGEDGVHGRANEAADSPQVHG